MTILVILGFLLLAEAPLLLWRLTAGEGLARTTVHMMGYVIVCQVVFSLYAVAVFADPGNPCAYNSQITMPGRMMAMFGALFAVFCAVDALCPRARGVWANSRITLVGLLQRAARFLPLVATAAAIYLVAFIATRNFGTLWNNSTYLLMVSRDGAINDGAFPSLLASLLSPAYFMICIFLAVALVVRRKFEAAMLFACALAIFLFQASGASRAAAVGIFLYCLTHALLSRRIGWSTIALAVLGIYTFQAALTARGMGTFGISNFWTVMAYPLTEGLNFGDLLKNLFQGAISTPDGLLVAGDFSDRYRWLSFSPLPSFIDGFDQIRVGDELRLNQFCPMSGVTEVIRFGPLFWVITAGQYAAMVVAINSRPVVSRTGLLPVLCVNLLFSVFTVIGFTYPLRNVLRPMTYAFVALMLYALLSKGTPLFRGPVPSSRPPRGRYVIQPRRTRR